MNFLEITLDLLSGFGLTCLLFVLTLLFAIPLGLLLSFCSMSKCKAVKAGSRVYIWIIRGIPLMLLICMIYYLPGLLGKPGTINVFDTANFTVGGEKIDSYQADVDTDDAFTPDTEVVEDGIFQESKFRSAPYFDLRIDGITLLDEAY
jgi:His/Glu/Gln/Arg/opine family amino acid ABC transporter permease subunit